MTDDPNTEQELEEQEGQPLPDREVMSVITPDPSASDGFVSHDPPPPEPTEPHHPIDWSREPVETPPEETT